MTAPFVIIGGDAAGMSAASKAKREDPDRDVIVFEKGEWVSYAACGMPYYVKGTREPRGPRRRDTRAVPRGARRRPPNGLRGRRDRSPGENRHH